MVIVMHNWKKSISFASNPSFSFIEKVFCCRSCQLVFTKFYLFCRAMKVDSPCMCMLLRTNHYILAVILSIEKFVVTRFVHLEPKNVLFPEVVLSLGLNTFSLMQFLFL